MSSSKPLILGWGYEAQSGKDTCCSYLKKTYKGSKILVTAFAKKLRKEIHSEMYQIVADHHCSHREALKAMCERAGVPHDPFAIRDENNYYGKQRRLQQWWGTEFRRTQNPNYWLDAVAQEIESSGADIILISDLRFSNEAAWINSIGGKTVHVNRLAHKALDAKAAAHVSEQELSGHKFDYVIENSGTLKELYAKANQVFADARQVTLF